ncbi:TetR/AcrR family transcriptional regulator [Antrihabitans cavernicola]|uniref:TetR/AcrR family transcriptional regulator n=1 Tax=Antrihabitans cavernicola TaxID=2495913 RepID=A0A5A7S9Z5_9NOCA|nr:TetR-like C-terminal domain-containing protein [Spelaeibacter cavernicola]KAA0021657.1 TetR/AcrR family transcriptional regulator [Spelaeibacter cavernicola]
MARAGLTQIKLVTAAGDLADRIGFDNVTIAALARGFGIKDASIYSHIKNLHDLRVQVALSAAQDFADRIGAAVAGRSGKDALVAFADAYREFAVHHPGRYAATQMQLDATTAESSPAYRRILDTTYALFHGYGLTEPDLTDAVRLLRSFFHGFAALEASGGFGHPRGLATSWQRDLDALDFTLRHWSSTHD